MLVSTHYMDEAERCDRIVYILNGKLVARGTVAEVIAHSGLSTWTVDGDDLNGLAAELAGQPGVDMVALFGASLHVSVATNPREATIAPLPQRRMALQDSEPSLEDVFIHLMSRPRTISNERTTSDQSESRRSRSRASASWRRILPCWSRNCCRSAATGSPLP